MITESSLPYSLWTPTYDDNDELDENKASTYAIVNVVENSNSLGIKKYIVINVHNIIKKSLQVLILH